ncbi:hypothetical protein PpBr36_05444 [Pyricularia pennisetigena]|uniref:hypothetical protein n=1 Tax=Pyricularia pennisetigena TaxID=1578925 RepID=UPI0011530E29|nr:hypothetical protein PpBr36_05444 [Pyricularia pennisetigena]TLS27480.1 hypothetical protein PpBr36_05444 [Pyricularia pennisetigena]
MLPPLPELSDYGVSPTSGFLPEVLPLSRLPDPYYNKWEAVAANLQALILSKRLRPVLDRLPVLSTIGLEHDAEWRRAYSILCFMAHGYIWGGDSPSDRLPASISVPLLQVAERLDVAPVATYAAVCLWNFKPLFADEPIDDLENLATLSTFTGSIDESWFYLVSVAIEARGAATIPLMLKAIQAARDGDADTVTSCLVAFAERIDDLGNLLQRVHENCDPHIFYHRIRPFLAGSKNMADAGLPHGVIYEDASGNESYRQYSGGSNAQSSIIQFFDIVLGIEHRPTGAKKAGGDQQQGQPKHGRPDGSAPPQHNFIMEMRRYMPGGHARFLGAVASVANIRQFVEARSATDKPLALAYDACLAMLRALRDRHIAIVARYIVVPSREAMRDRSRSSEAVRGEATAGRYNAAAKVNLATAVSRGPKGIALDTSGSAGKKDQLKGTGGTALIAFLKQARDETGEPAIEAWTRRFIKRGNGKVPGSGDFFLGKEDGPDDDVVQVNGLAGMWIMEGEGGGICNY